MGCPGDSRSLRLRPLTTVRFDISRGLARPAMYHDDCDEWGDGDRA
jgi:hypothetical protein